MAISERIIMKQKRKISVLVCILAGFLLSGCHVFERKQQAGAAVEVCGQYLYQSTLDSLALGLTGEDSIRVVQQYIGQWAKDILMYDNATKRTNQEIEALVEDYRRSLYVHAYEQHLVDKNMPKAIADSAIQQIYDAQPDRFKLKESIVQGMLIVVPNGTPDIQKIRQRLDAAGKSGDISPKEMDEIEKYAYQYASGYELFVDRWETTSELLTYIPLERNELENMLRQQKQIEYSDSTKTYLLQVTKKYMRGEAMPIGYAQPEIEKIILSRRQVEFLQREREKIYQDAIREKKVIFF